jgi:2-polyprenyl-3-methyl-5-hydroxy-6-metoxy-1,4-benzoquinol methylase
VQALFYEILSSASSFSSWNMLKGTGKKALDIGCAFGYGVELLGSLGYDVTGIDVSRYALDRARNLSPANLVLCDASNIPLRGHTFDLITCFEVLEHVADPLLPIAEASRLLGSQGLSIWTTPVRGQVQKMYDFMRRERTHASILQKERIECLMSKYFRSTRLLTYLLLPIPPQLLRRYFLIRRTPFLASSGVIIVCTGPLASPLHPNRRNSQLN